MTEAYQVGPFVLDAEAGVLSEAGAPLPLGGRGVAVLATLVRAAPQFVPKARIIEAAWPGVVVEEGNLAVQVLAIRRVLARAPGGAQWLETLPRRGYRFVGPFARLPQAAATGAPGSAEGSNLPEPLTSFIGRERELAELRVLLAGNRLLTLTGTGGVGKTRLAMRVAAAAAPAYREGVWLVELAALHDPELVPQAVATALALREQPRKSLTRVLLDHLHARTLLLVLDNAEHLLPACAHLTDALLRHCPQLTVLVTSRERLGVPGERTYRVPSLALPDPQRDATVKALAECDAVRLFAQRAQLHAPRFTVDESNATALAGICHRLDGIALAIELAAARVHSMSVAELGARLDRRFDLLTGGARTVPPRQQTLRAALDWSYDLLEEREKALLCRLSAFAGGWTLDAAETVCAGAGLAAGEVLDLLAALVDKSLVVAEERAGATRYRLPETLNQYASDRLLESGAASEWHRRHLEHFRALAEAAEPELTGKDQQAWLDRLASEHDNLRAALARTSAADGDVMAGLRLAIALCRFWLVRGYPAEGRAWLARLVGRPVAQVSATRAKALNWAGIFAWKQADYAAAQAAYDDSLAIRRALGDRPGIGAVLNNLGLLAYEHGDYAAAQTLHEQSLAIDRELGDRWGVGVSLLHLGSLVLAQGDVQSARAHYEESLAIFREHGDRGHVANALRSLGGLHNRQGDHSAARALYEESLAICRELGDRSGMAWAGCGLGFIAIREADQGAARASYAESLALFRGLGDREGIAAAVEGLAEIACATGEVLRAARVWGAMERLREEIGAPRVPGERERHDQAVAAARAVLGNDTAFDREWQHGRTLPLEPVIAIALGPGAAQ